MTALIETLNLWGDRLVPFALPMLIQSSVLIAVLLALDLILREKVHAFFRYGLWMLVLIKLVLPPSFASPTGLGYWLPTRQTKQPDKSMVTLAPVQITVGYSEVEPIHVPSTNPPPVYKPKLTWSAISFLGWATVAFGLLTWLILRARFVARMSARANNASESLREVLESCRRQLKIKRPVRLKSSTEASGPAVCGLWRPTILIPAPLTNKLSALRMRAVLLHELSHIKRGDLWVNHAQTLLQIFYWYNPLLWFANAIIRRVREQAVDEMVMVEMGQTADAYPTTLLEVAKLTFSRSVLSLGLVGIMESKNALRGRIDRLLDFRPPRKAGLTFTSALCVFAVGALAVPMSKAPSLVPVAMNLVHREYRVDLLSFARNLIKRGGLPEIRISGGDVGRSHNRNAYDGPLVSGRPNSLEDRKMVERAIRRVLTEAGVETRATEIDVWRFNSSEVWVQTTPEKLAAIERVLTELNGAPLQDASRGLSRASPPRYLPPFARVFRSESLIANAANAQGVAQNDVENGFAADTNAPAAGQTNGLPNVDSQKIEAAKLVQDGKVLFEAGKWDEAEAKLNWARREDSGNPGVDYYLNLIREIRYAKLARERKQTAIPIPLARPNLVQTNKLRQAILSKLDQIRFDQVRFDGLPLSEVVRTLVFESKKRDPDKKGINFMINEGVSVLNDPTTGLPATTSTAGAAEQMGISSVAIKINPTLSDVRLMDVLDAVVLVAEKPIKYSIEDYAVVFSAKTPEAAPLYTRFFKVDPNTFYANLRKYTGHAENIRLEEKLQAVREFFSAAGIDLQPPKDILLGGQGEIMIRATLQDLDILEQAVQVLNVAPPQIHIRVRFVEVSQDDSRALGIDWWLGNFLYRDHPDLRENTSPPSGIMPAAPDQPRARGLRKAGTVSKPFVGILTGPQSKVVQRALEQRSGVDSAEVSITTLNGRQTTLQITNLSSLQTNQFEGAPTLGVLPNILADGYTINLTLTFPSVEPSNYEHSPDLTNASPKLRAQEIGCALNVWDGQTMVLGGLIPENLPRKKDKVPILGDMPPLGRFFRSESEKKSLLIFVTPTLIDPAGNRFHTDEEMLFAKDTIPPQNP